ncbi:MAG TPA: YafY family protein [Chloroflexota bacterium]|nr:YafY family protein [Chloroflexota bacterium]
MAISLLLQARGKMTADHLADILGVSPRTIYRDINSLSLAHVPISMDYGPGGGYFIPESSQVASVTFTGEEAIALALGGVVAGGSQLFDAGERLRGALIKLEAVLPEEYRHDVRVARERILVDISGWYRSPSPPPLLETIRSAVWRQRRIDIFHFRADGSAGQWRCVDPLGLIWKAATWYLAAWCHLRQDYRVFHLNRIREVIPRDEPIDSRPDFDLEVFWDETRRRFEERTAPITLTFRADPTVLGRLDSGHVRVREEADGTAIVRVCVDSIDMAVAHVLSLGPGVTVLDPSEVRHEVAISARQIAGRYG